MINCKNIFSKGVNIVNSGIDKIIASNESSSNKNNCPFANNTTPFVGNKNSFNGHNCPFVNNVSSNAVNSNKGCDLWIYSEKTKSYVINKKTPKNNRAVGLLKFAAKKSIAMAKRIIPGIVMMTTAFTLGPTIRSCADSTHQNASPSANIVYESGKQHAIDSIKIAELERKIAQDSIKFKNTLDSINVSKVRKIIK